jgi:hypothetical protein
MDLFKCYQVLGVSRDCTWDELRTAYRRQVQKHHPDRFQQQPDKQLIAKERMLELNKAFDTLEEYFKKTGHLPTDTLKRPAVEPATYTQAETVNPQTNTRPSYSAPDIKPAKSNQTTRRTSWGLVIVIAILGYYFFWETVPEPDNSYSNASSGVPLHESNTTIRDGTLKHSSQDHLPKEIDSNQVHTEPGIDRQMLPSNNLAPLGMQGKIDEGPYFTYGDTPGKVFEVQGVPTRTVGDIWFYGSSEVHFNKGVVVSWYNSPSHPLNAK